MNEFEDWQRLAMKIIGVEEHFAMPKIVEAWKSVDPRWRDLAVKASTEGDGEGLRD